MSTKTKLLALFASVSGSIFIVSLVQILFLVFGDISAGALRGEPETGWGFVISFFFLGPIAIVSLVIFLLLGKKYKNATQKSIWRLWATSLVLAILIFVGHAIYDRVTQPPDNPRDVKMSMALNDISRKIDDLFYKNKGILPSESEMAPSLVRGTSYQTINENTFTLCGNFETSTVRDYYDGKNLKSENDKSAKRVVDGVTLQSHQFMGVFVHHNAGTQCYKIKLRKPITQ